MSHRLQGATITSPARRTRAEDFLEALQDRIYGSLGLSAEECQQREWLGQQMVLPERLQQKALELPAAEFERYRDALFQGLARDEAAPRPTRFERPHQYSILREVKTTIERAVGRVSFDLPARPVIGTLPTQSLEPLMVRVPDSGDVIVLVDGGLLTYSNLLAKAVAQALPFDVPEAGEPVLVPPGPDWVRRIDERGTARARFLELMLATLDGRPASAPPYLPEPRYEHVAADLCDFMEIFVLAREYGRLIEGDHRSPRTRRRSVHGQSFDALAWTADEDLRADSVALVLLLAAANDEGASLAWAFWAADVFLASLGMLERAAWLASGGSGHAIVTPMPAVHDHRRQALRELLRHWDGGQQAVAFADSLEPVLDALESGFETHFYEERFGDVAVH